MPLMRDLHDFVRTHKPCKGMSGDATRPTIDGYLVWVACECGERFERWVTPEAAEDELEGWEKHLRN